ncbi:MAG TPA: acyloxyacyl hydrolase [Caulobacterales bacterium]|nr:acyloxyacyl hydrolase [Caulobacterales bacterium]
MRFVLAGLAFAFACSAAPAYADIDEIRLGVVQHNIRTDHGDLASPKEDGPNIEGELVYTSPHWSKWMGSPRPYLMASINTHGNTSFAGFGLYWRWEFANHWAFEPGFGYVLHNGKIDVPDDLKGTPAGIEFANRHQLLGSRDLFRSSFALEREMGRRMGVQLYYEHMSHGEILGRGRNQGLDEAGVRFLYRFNPDASD